MKKLLLLTLFTVTASLAVEAQLQDGTYITHNGKGQVTVEVCENGSKICNFSIIGHDKTEMVCGIGEWKTDHYFVQCDNYSEEIMNLMFIRHPKEKNAVKILFGAVKK